jgi:uncharacterized repeat protein (TIGR03803 family)
MPSNDRSVVRDIILFLIAMLASGVTATLPAGAQTLTVLHSFTGGADGGNPYTTLLRDANGNLYGTAATGGTGACNGDENGCGVVFKLDTTGTETVLYNFTGYPTDGSGPSGNIARDKHGSVYGSAGGGMYTLGMLFRVDTAGRETVLYNFGTAKRDAEYPNGVILDSAGSLYGAAGGGSFGAGAVFKLDSTGKETVLYSFTGKTDGSSPEGVIRDVAGNLYGATYEGGDFGCNNYGYGCGTVFRLDVAGKETTLYTFTGPPSDGTRAGAGVVRDAAGNLYGTTSEGGSYGYGYGTVFKVDTNGKETVLHSFAGGADGAAPYAELILDDAGNLYGTTSIGGTGACYVNGYQVGCGTVYEIDSSGKEIVLYSFMNGSDGSYPSTGLVRDAKGNLYGTTVLGSGTGCYNHQGCGAIFKLSVAPAVSFDPTSLNFGSQTVGIKSSPQVVTLINTGNAILTIKSIGIGGTNSGDFAETNHCPTSLAPNDSCRIAVTFTPSATGTRNATVSVADNAANSPQTVPLTGVGVLPAVSLSPTNLTFPTQVVYTDSAPQRVKLTNTGAGILIISQIGATVPFSQTNNCGKTVAPGAHCTITVRFYPKTKGVQKGTVSVTDNAPDSPQTVPLTGTGTIVLLEPKDVNFGSQPVGTRSLRRTIALSNKGHAVVNITSISITGVDARDFAENNNCGKQVESGSSCFIRVTFKPLAGGKRTADVTVKDDGGGNSQNVKLSGTGT